MMIAHTLRWLTGSFAAAGCTLFGLLGWTAAAGSTVILLLARVVTMRGAADLVRSAALQLRCWCGVAQWLHPRIALDERETCQERLANAICEQCKVCLIELHVPSYRLPWYSKL
jgi:hypothetical protein